MGHDGYKGCERIRNSGGAVLVQDELSSVVWGMPGIVARSGLADKIVPLEEIAGEIVRHASVGTRRKAPVG
jgi:two-component system chemotaxis response regulator CheB